MAAADIPLRDETRPSELRSRLGALALLIVGTVALILGRLWTLQVVDGAEYAELAERNHLKEREIPAPRGSIYDAHGHRIAEVRASFDLVVSPEDVAPSVTLSAKMAAALSGGPLMGRSFGVSSKAHAPDSGRGWLETKVSIDDLAARLALLLDDTDAATLVERFESGRMRSAWRPVVLAEDLELAQVQRVLAQRPWLPGLRVESRHRRSYPDGALFSHLVGYLREVRSDELADLRQRHQNTEHGTDWYQVGDLIGKYGMEAAYEEWLRGTDGAYWVQVDVHGRELGRSTGWDLPGEEYFRSIAHFLDQSLIPETPGHDLHLTVRTDLQRQAVELLGEQTGAVAMMEVHTGRILALANVPGFDPEIFSRRISPADWKALSEDPAHPLVDKSLQGLYPPGSTWKMVVAAALLGSGLWDASARVNCAGSMKVGNRRFRCWNRRGHGKVDLKGALKESCDVYFYRAGLALGIDEVHRYAAMFGMGNPTGIGINSEATALNPSTGWKKNRYRSRPRQAVWTPGDTASAVIGQGYTLVTPLQITRMTAALANGGTIYKPLLVDRILRPDGSLVQRGEPEPVAQVDLAERHFHSIREGMLAVVDEVGGTAFRQRLKHLAFAGKTGTAQVVRLGAAKSQRYKDHAWFLAFAPYDDPQVAITVLVENGEHGSTAAAPIARKLLESYFREEIDSARQAGVRLGGGSPVSSRTQPAPALSSASGRR